MGNTKFYFGRLVDVTWEEIEKIADEYTYGVIYRRHWHGTHCTPSTIPIINHKAHKAYLGTKTDWRIQKVMKELEKYLSREHNFDNIEGNRIPKIVWAYMISEDPILAVQMGCVVEGEIFEDAGGFHVTKSHWRVHSELTWGGADITQFGNLIIRKMGCEKWEFLLENEDYNKEDLIKVLKK